MKASIYLITFVAFFCEHSMLRIINPLNVPCGLYMNVPNTHFRLGDFSYFFDRLVKITLKTNGVFYWSAPSALKVLQNTLLQRISKGS